MVPTNTKFNALEEFQIPISITFTPNSEAWLTLLRNQNATLLRMTVHDYLTVHVIQTITAMESKLQEFTNFCRCREQRMEHNGMNRDIGKKMTFQHAVQCKCTLTAAAIIDL